MSPLQNDPLSIAYTAALAAMTCQNIAPNQCGVKWGGYMLRVRDSFTGNAEPAPLSRKVRSAKEGWFERDNLILMEGPNLPLTEEVTFSTSERI